MRRRPVVVSRRGPGIMGTMARTAVVAGTATVVARGVSGAMSGGAQQQAPAEQAPAEQAAAQQTATADEAQQAQAAAAPPPVAAPEPVAAPAPASAAPASDLMAQLQQLMQMKEVGALTDEEFTAAKAKLLA